MNVTRPTILALISHLPGPVPGPIPGVTRVSRVNSSVASGCGFGFVIRLFHL